MAARHALRIVLAVAMLVAGESRATARRRAAGLAAVVSGLIPGEGPVVVVLSGGNVDPILLIRLIEHGLTAAGRFLVLSIVVVDHPGELAHLTEAVARLGLNVLDVEHHRVGLKLGVDKVAVMMTLETRDQAHRDDAVRSLREAGFDVQPVE